MNAEKILYAIGNIDDRFIESATMPQKTHSKKTWVTWTAFAACMAVIAAGIFICNKKAAESLPMLSISGFDGGMGMEAYLAYNIDELVNANPWTKENTPDTLPVYNNTLYKNAASGDFKEFDMTELKKILLDAAKKLGMNTADLKPVYDGPTSSLSVEDENYLVEIHPWMRLTVTAKNKSILPDCYTPDCYASYEEYCKSAEYLIEKFSAFLDMEKPVINIFGGDYNAYGQRSFSLEIYDGAGSTEEQIKAFNFEGVFFYTDDDGILHFSKNCYNLNNNVIGDYPIISADEALEQLLDGKYVTSVFQEIASENKIKKVELVYHTSMLSENFMPYYKFYVEIENTGDIAKDFPGMKTYGAYYVPAVEGEYIDALPMWNGYIN